MGLMGIMGLMGTPNSSLLTPHSFLFHIKDRLVGLWVFRVEVNSRVIHLDVVSFHKLVNLSTRPKRGAVSVCCKVVDWTVGIESRVEGEACSHTSSFYLALCIDVRVDVVPGKDGLSAVGFCINPALVDGMGDTVAVNGGAGGLLICVGTVEQLVPCAIVVLERHQASEVLLEPAHDER